ncbi:MAG TPA: YqcC family protein [Flavisolibacter sp.]|nr:YqcC family protein [Flavisolibacter sp.]
MPNATAIKEKVKELTEQLKAEGLWKQHEPRWVTSYREGNAADKDDFFEWLQFIYLPNLLSEENHYSYAENRTYIAPQAIHFFGQEKHKTRLLQLFVELDALI